MKLSMKNEMYEIFETLSSYYVSHTAITLFHGQESFIIRGFSSAIKLTKHV